MFLVTNLSIDNIVTIIKVHTIGRQQSFFASNYISTFAEKNNE